MRTDEQRERDRQYFNELNPIPTQADIERARIAELKAALRALVEREDAGLFEIAGKQGCKYCRTPLRLKATKLFPHAHDCPIVAGRKALGGEN